MKSSVTKDGLMLPPRIWSVYHPRWGAAWCGTNVKKADLFVMTPEEFAAVYPLVLRWIRQTLADHAQSAKPVASRGFKRLPLYFSQQLLDTTKVVPVLRVPVPLPRVLVRREGTLLGSRVFLAFICMGAVTCIKETSPRPKSPRLSAGRPSSFAASIWSGASHPSLLSACRSWRVAAIKSRFFRELAAWMRSSRANDHRGSERSSMGSSLSMRRMLSATVRTVGRSPWPRIPDELR